MFKREPNNLDRASWANTALRTFQKETGTDACDAVSDLLCDLMHLCDARGDRFGDFEAQLERARSHYAEELAEESEPETDPENIYGLPGVRQSIEEERK